MYMYMTLIQSNWKAQKSEKMHTKEKTCNMKCYSRPYES